MYLSILLSAVLSSPILRIATAEPLNVTLDDKQIFADKFTGGYIAYHPEDGCQWVSSCTSPTCECTSANRTPNISFAWAKSWHEGSYLKASDGDVVVKAEVLFAGTDVHVYSILSLDSPASDITFIIDGEVTSHYDQSNINGLEFIDGFSYNYRIFSSTGLSSTYHNLTIAVGLNNGPSTFFLDHILYIYDPTTTISSVSIPTVTSSNPPPTSTPAHPKVQVIVGSVLGSIAAVTSIALLYICCFRTKRRRRLADLSNERANPFPTSSYGQDTQQSQPLTISIPTKVPKAPESAHPTSQRHPTLSPIPFWLSGLGNGEGQRSPSALVSADTAISLATEVQRLREENIRLSGRPVARVNPLPPPYLEDLDQSL